MANLVGVEICYPLEILHYWLTNVGDQIILFIQN